MLSVPNFCPSCGVGLGGKTTPAPVKKISRASMGPAQINTDDPEGVDINEVPRLQGLEYDIDGDYSSVGSRKINLGHLLGNQEGQPQQPPTPQPPKTTKAKKKGGRPKKAKASQPPTTAQRFEAVKGTIDECKSSANNVVDVQE
tara:strand:+ start:786 stop:1217 length:432 start_codon:yes stop_codon:yes gene_type:complete